MQTGRGAGKAVQGIIRLVGTDTAMLASNIPTCAAPTFCPCMYCAHALTSCGHHTFFLPFCFVCSRDKKKRKKEKSKDKDKAKAGGMTHSEDFGKYGIIREVCVAGAAWLSMLQRPPLFS